MTLRGQVSKLGRRLMVVSLTLSLFTVWSITPAFAACTIDGQVYRDFNASGLQDALEPGVAGITVTAFDVNGATYTATTNATGDYSLDLTGAPDDEARVEFSGLPTFLRSGPAGGQSTTTVTFVDCGGGATVNGIDLALANPGQYCHTANPTVVSSCYVYGDQTQGVDAVIEFPYASGDTSTFATPLDTNTGHSTLALDSDVGAVWGTAYHRSSDSVYMSAVTKRHVGFAPGALNGGTGIIYRINRFTGAVSILTDINAFFPAAGGAYPHDTVPIPPSTDPFFDDLSAWANVGKTAFGDIDISDDDQTLYAVTMGDGRLYEIPLNPNGTAGLPVPRTLPSPTDCPSPSDIRPGALKFSDGLLYVGLTCTAESTQDRDDLRAYVYSFNPTSSAYTQVANFALNYPRGCASRGGAACAPAAWNPWTDDPADMMSFLIFNQSYLPQPWLLDIEFDENGFMIVGLFDRAGHQFGNRNDGSGPQEGVVAGDILRLSPNGGSWTLESNGSDGVTATGGANNGQGPGPLGVPPGPFGEFYFHERFRLTVAAPTHDEITLSGLWVLPGSGEVLTAAFDPSPASFAPMPAALAGFRSGGVIWLSNTTGQRTRSYEIFAGDAPFTFGKAAGVGDAEGLCGPAPLEIGNRVWEDLDLNGRQDPGEVVFANVVLSLYIDLNGDGSTETPVATTTTNANGEYIFSETTILASLGSPALAVAGTHFLDINGDNVRQSNEPFGILPFMNYEVRIEDPINYGVGDPLENYFATVDNAQANLRDSDGEVTAPGLIASAANVPTIRLTTGNFGENDHTFDFGFNVNPPVVPTATPVLGTPSPSGTPVASALLTNLIITKQVNPPFALPGSTVTWTISVTNPNAVSVSNVVVEDDFADELEILSWSSSAGSITVNGQFWTFSLPSLGAGVTASATVTTRIRPNVQLPFIISNVAAVQGVQVPPSATSSGVGAGLGLSGFGRGVGYARATLVSVTRLPSTGESSLVLVAIALGVTAAIGVLMVLRRRTSS